MEDILASIRRILNEGDGESSSEGQEGESQADETHLADTTEQAPAAEVPPFAETPPFAEALGVASAPPAANASVIGAPVIAAPARHAASHIPHAADERPSVAVTAPGKEHHPMALEKETQYASPPGIEPIEGDDVFILDSAMMVADTAIAEPFADEAPIASDETVEAASQSVSALKRALIERQAQIYQAKTVSLEEIVREEVRPMLKSWLDAHLPSIVERLVRTEIERVVAREML
jgi:cell pole-organizing protein PopZ